MALNCIGYASVLVEEICLEGLDGITLESLWVRLSVRFQLEIPPAFRKKLWNMILQLKCVQFYLLPEPRPIIKSYNRLESIDERGNFTPIPTDDLIYGYFPCQHEKGSCKFYSKRKNITDQIRKSLYEDVWKDWYNTLVIVGDKEQRWNALAPTSSFSTNDTLTNIVYCILERVGRSRRNGEVTFGEHSLTSIEKVPKTLAYFHKQLKLLNLVQKQHVSVKNNNVSTTCVLLHLTRFYHRAPNTVQEFVDSVENYIIQSPGKFASVDEVKKLFVTEKLSFKKMVQSSLFAKRIKVNKISNDDIEMPSVDSKGKSPRNCSRIVLQLIEESKLPDECSNSIDNSSEPRGSAIMGEGLLRQVYRCIYASKHEGISMKDISRMLGTEFSTIKLAIKYLLLHDLLHVSVFDYRRQRTSRYISKEFQDISKEVQEKKNNSTDEKKTSSNNSTAFKNTKVTELSIATDTNSVPSTSSLSTVEIQNVTAESKDLVLTFTQSSKKIQRINLISKFLAENHITCRLNDVKNYITKHEKTKPGDNGLIDQRSLKRLIYQMEREGQLKVMQIKITVEPYNSSLLFICEPSIDVHHIYVKRNIEQTKHKLILKKSQLSVDSQHVSQIWSCKKRIIGGPYPFLPKFARLRIFHEFLFYLTYAHKNKVVELPVDVQNLLRKEELFTEELPLAFEDSLEKCMFVPPLENIGFPSGWILLSDAISRLPLCLLSNLCFTNPNIPGISDYLNDPIRCQTMLKHLPPPVQYYLTYKGRYKFILHKIVEQLCLLGLVQFGKQIMKDKDKICIYINRNAILWDTTSSKPGYHKIEDKEYDKESFKFLTLDDIKKYWNRMCIICNNTRLGQRYAALGEEVESMVPEDKMSYALEKQEYDEAKKADIGYIPGDGQGAAGLDTMFYSHLKRSWTNNLIVANCVNSEKNPVLRKKNIASRGEKHFPPSISKSKKKVRVLKMRKPMNIRSPRHDDTDKKLMEKYGSKRTSWKSTEDQILFLFKIAFHIIYPPGFSMNFHIIRDFMNIVCKVAKPTSSYRRRMIYLMRRPQNFRQVEIHLTEFRRDEVINSNYNNLYNQMKKGIYKKKPISIVDDKCRIRLVELVNLLYQKFIEKNAQNQISILLPRTLSELYNEYEIETPSLYKPEHKEIISLDLKSEIKYNILKSLIHSAMSCSIGKETFTFSLFDTYKNFPEGMLRSTINSLRLSGMISVNKYELQGGDRKKIKTSTNASHFKLSQSYFIQAITTLPSTLYTEAYKYVDALKTELQTGNSAQVTGGGVAALFDLMSANLIDIHLVTPPSSSNALVSHSKSRFSKNKIVAQTECSVLSEKNMQRTYVIAGYGWNISACSDMESNIFYTSQVLDSISNEIISNSLLFLDRNKSNFISSDYLYKLDESILDQVSQFIHSKCEIGASQDELKEMFVTSQIITMKDLCAILLELINRNKIRRLGNITWRWVSQQYCLYWCIKGVPCTKEIKKPSNIENIIPSDDNKNTCVDSLIESNPTNTLEENQNRSTKRKREDSENEESILFKKFCGNDALVDSECDVTFKYFEEGDSRIDDNEISANDAMDTFTNISEGLSNTETEPPKAEVNFVSPRPWIRPDGSLNRASLFHWMGAILNHVLLHPVMSLVELQKRFNYLQLHEIQFLIEIMEKIKCVKIIRVTATKKPSLFNKNTALDLIIEKPTGLEDVEELFIEVLEAATIKFATFKGQILDMN